MPGTMLRGNLLILLEFLSNARGHGAGVSALNIGSTIKLSADKCLIMRRNAQVASS
jgi:hypothetical protein